MKKISFYALMLALSFFTFISCDDSTPKPTPEPNPIEGTHFDVWTPIGGNAGMGSLDCLVKRVAKLESGEISFDGSGVDVSQKMLPTVMFKGKYYYMVSKDGRFGKFQIGENNLSVVKEIPFSALKDRRHTHAWLNDKTLLLVGSNGPSDKILWAKIDVDAMTILSEGELTLPQPPKGQVYNTSGIAAYRKSDSKVLYSFKYNKAATNGTEPADEFYMAFVNSATMSVEKVVTENRAEMMASTAYGELRQDKSFFDENGDYYLACNSVLPGEVNGKGKVTTTAQHGALLRVKNGATDFDKSFNGYTRERGKIVTATYLNNGKAVLYMQDPKYATPDNLIWDSTDNPYVFYWLVVDLKSGVITDLREIPFSNGNFSQLAIVVGKKAYIGSNPKEGQSHVMVYDIPSGKLTKGATISVGFPVDRLVQIEN